jgi:hypothetical protein
MNTILQEIVDEHSQPLPENLYSGAVVVSPSGAVAKIVRTANTNGLGERLYRLRYFYRFLSGRLYTVKSRQPVIEKGHKGFPVIVGFGFTRDELVQMQCVYIRKENVDTSKIIERVPLYC